MAIVQFPVLPACRKYFIIACIVHGITVISLGLRLAARVINKTKVGWDDFLVSLSAVFTSGMVGVYGVGKCPNFFVTSEIYFQRTGSIRGLYLTPSVNIVEAIRYGYGHPLRETLVNFEFLAKVSHAIFPI